MITLFIDESGHFENEKDIENVVVGGILIKHERIEELNNLSKIVELEFKKIYNSEYHKFIHGKTRDIKKQKEIISKILNGGGKFNSITPTFMAKGKVNALINSNITDDNTAGMLYFNMINSLVSTILLYYPNITNKEKEINIFIASRITKLNTISGDKIHDLESIGMDKTTKQNGDTIYFLNNQTSILINLHNELSNNNLIQQPIDVKLKKVIVNYENREEELMNMFYLADIVCNEVYNKRKLDESTNLCNAISFYYDDINSKYKKIYKYYVEKKLFKFLENTYDFDILFRKNNFKHNYDNYIRFLKENISEIISKDSIRDTLYLIKEFTSKGKYDRKKVLYLLLFLKDHLKKLNNLNKIIYYELLLRVYNDMGLVKEASKTYNDLLNLAIESSSFEMIDRKRNFLNLYTSTLANIFDFKKALSINESLIRSQLILQEELLNIEAGLFDKVTDIDTAKGMQLGKYYSAKAQSLSFLNDPSAIKYYMMALNLLKDHPRNRNQTTSYLVHFLCDHSNIQIDRKITDYLDDYFKGKSFNERLEFLIQEDKYMSRTYELFALLKIYLHRSQDQIDYSILNRLVERVLIIPVYKLQHPWQLILFTLAKLYSMKNKGIAEKLLEIALEYSLSNPEQTTIYLIGLMIKINVYPNENSVNDFIKYIEHKCIEELNQYFDVEKVKSAENIEDKVELVLSKFRFTYH
ncbi:hypothetical protein CN692_07545 [Bacillus sp. AFS002410]|uniref:hypothetical protein n=1 Tax=Bacillus sp. AFS002410 TaxID=2033481 RepID=UPI000BF13F2B|nr:hypothetical protein [Bacillus sp. AFS002410]PEJ58821.1 hypothetical protein CN692_07545 [Bacillus sp. AFS002410]